MIKYSLIVVGWFSFSMLASADVGLVATNHHNQIATDRISCVHWSNNLSTSLQAGVTDRFQVLLPSANKNVMNTNETVRFKSKLKTFGPEGFVQVPIAGAFFVKVRHAGAIDITGQIKLLNPYVKSFDFLTEQNPAIYQDSFIYLKNRIRDTTKNNFKSDFKPLVDKIAGGLFCDPVLEHNGPKNPDNVRLIQGR